MLTFDQVCQEIADKPTSILLGNGFSVAFDNKFLYANLKYKVFEKAFGAMDVEDIMLRVINHPQYLVECLQKGFIGAISEIHPDWADDYKKKSCVVFLKNFSKVYTLSYDLLLYWVINSDQELQKRFVDGFGFTKEQRHPDWPNVGRTSTYYMHGSLLLHCSKDEHDDSVCPRKPNECCLEKYKRPQRHTGLIAISSLIQILRRQTDTRYPHFVSEGTPNQKYVRIQRCTYLKGCYDALKSESGNLVIFGVSFAKDIHILKAIRESNVKCCYVSIHSGDEEVLRKRVKTLESDSRIIKFYAADTARVWG